MSQGTHPTNRSPAPLFWRWVALAILLIGLDQVTKYHFNTVLHYGQRLNVLPFFDFTLLYNEGAAFSFLAGADGWQRWFFTALGFAASALILFLLRRHANQRRFSLALVLILGGALGNVIDRLQHGHVVDFLLFYWNNAYFPAFNVADICITVGAILMLWDELARARRARTTP
ncbi:signal peptidase II [Kerstersia similis]|uniref:signal peptidase II n=1 Tax=Kerstersia similis TaxID=206505 RepID=UPI0039F1444B